jgi:hypothetical protein
MFWRQQILAGCEIDKLDADTRRLTARCGCLQHAGGDLRRSKLRDNHDVFWLEIAVHDRLFMKVRQSRHHLAGDVSD